MSLYSLRTAGVHISNLFTRNADVTANQEISISDFKQTLASLGPLASGLKAAEVDKLMRKLDLYGSGRVSLEAIANLRGVPFKPQQVDGRGGVEPAAAINDKLKNIVRRAAEDGLSVEYAFKHFDKEGTGFVCEAEFEQGLRQLGVFKESDEILHAAIHAWKKDASDLVSMLFRVLLLHV